MYVYTCAIVCLTGEPQHSDSGWQGDRGPETSGPQKHCESQSSRPEVSLQSIYALLFTVSPEVVGGVNKQS